MGVRRQAHRAWRWSYFLLATLLVLLSLPVFGALVLAARLWSGPMDVTDSARRLLAKEHVQGLTLGHASLAWNGWKQGPRAPLGLLLDDVRFGEDQAAHAVVALDVVALLQGHAAVVSFAADDAKAVIFRDRAGHIRLRQGAEAASPQGGMPTAAARGGVKAQEPLDLGRIDSLHITRTVVALRDAGSGKSCRADIADLDLASLRRPVGIGVTGQMAASLSCGTAPGAHLTLRATGSRLPEGGITWHMKAADPVVPAAFAAIVPSLAALDVPMHLALDAGFAPAGTGSAPESYLIPHRFELTALLDAGTIHGSALTGMGIKAGGKGKPGGAPLNSDLSIGQGRLHVVLHLPDSGSQAVRVELLDSSLVLAGDLSSGSTDAPVLRLSGVLSKLGPKITGRVDAGIARMDFAGLRQIWPAALVRGAQEWVTGNITNGIAHNLAVGAAFESDNGRDGLHLASLTGGLDASDLTVWWLRPIAPLRGLDARMIIEGTDALRIDTRHAVQIVPRQGSIAIGPASLRITGLTQKDQAAHLDLHLKGALPDVIAVLAHPRLKLLSRHPLPFTDPAGSVDAHLTLHFPLIESVNANDIPVRVEAKLADVHLGKIAAGRDLDAGAMVLDATNDGLKVRGTGALGQLPSSLTYSMDFRQGGPGHVTETGHLSATVDEAAVRREGVDVAHRFTGTALLGLDYDRRQNGSGTIALDLDFTGSGLDTPFWRKQPGTAAAVTGHFGLQNDRLVSFDAVHATGPDLALDGHAELASGHPSALVIESFAIGRSRGAARIELPPARSRRPIRVELHGAVLDIAPYLTSPHRPPATGSGTQTGPADAPKPSDAMWRADLAFHQVLLNAGRTLAGMTLHAEARGTRVSDASLSVDAPAKVTARLVSDGPTEKSNRTVALDVQDAGALLLGLGVVKKIEGGILTMTGRMQDYPGGTRLTGLAKIGPFTIHDTPLAARLARDLSIYGFLTGAPSRQLVIARSEIPFVLEGDTLHLNGAHASNAALGATLRGPIDLGQDTLDLRGTIVPSYLFNALPGQLPGLGKVFSPEKGGGLLAVTLRLTGSLNQPVIRVNPLALLAPGILRRLLFD